MNALYASFGRPLALGLAGIVALWIAGLVLLPQLSLVTRAFQVQERGGESARLTVELERAYLRRYTIGRELRALDAPARAPSADASTGGASPDDPFAGVAPATKAPAMPPDPFADMPMPGSPARGQASAEGAAQAPAADPEATRAALVAENGALDARIEDMESRGAASARDAVRWSPGNFTSMSSLHRDIFVATLFYALCVTLLSLAVCYPVAWAIATAPTANRAAVLLLFLVVPYAINELLRIFAWVMILETRGLLNVVLQGLGLVGANGGVRWVASNGAVFTVMTYTYVLFMVFPIYNTIDTLDRNQVDAAKDLGASSWRVHARIVIPHARPGIAVGSIMTFMLSAGSIAVPEIVGRGMHPDWFSQVIYRRFFEADAWNQGAAYSLALLVACLAFVMVVMRLFGVGIRDIAR